MRTVRRYTIEQFLCSTKFLGNSFSPGEQSILLSCNRSGIFNAYSLPVAGGPLQQLTDSQTDNTYAVSFFPDGVRVLLAHDQGGDENTHLFVLDDKGRQTDLTPGRAVKSQYLGWSRDSASLYIATNERDPRRFDVYRMDAKTCERSLLYDNDAGHQVGAVSGDGRYVALWAACAEGGADIFLFDALTGTLECLTQADAQTTCRPAAFDVESRHLYFLTDEASEFSQLSKYEIATGRTCVVKRADWDVYGVRFSPSGRYRVITYNDETRTRVEIHDQLLDRAVKLPEFPDCEISAVQFSRSERWMSFYLGGDTTPQNLHVCEMPSQQVRRLTTSLNSEINAQDLVQSQSVRYRSFDGLEIPGLLWRPHGAGPERRVPALVWVHGGPGGQTRNGYSARIQFLVNHGYAVFGVNHRGSTGYGKSFLAADHHKHGREPLWDCVAAKEYLSTLDFVDAARIGIMGASYGGYMVLAALAFQPEVFAVGVDLFGVSNWVQALRSLPPYWASSFRRTLRHGVGDPETEEEQLRAISPLFSAHRISKPLLVLQGANDPRVTADESDQIVEAIRQRGGVVEYLLLPDEGHGFTKRANARLACQTILDFLDRYLKGATRGEAQKLPVLRNAQPMRTW